MPFPSPRSSRAPLSAVGLVALLGLPALVAADPPAPKTHAIFMGADVSIGLDRHLYRVQDVAGLSWVVDDNGRTREISTRSGALELKVAPSLKLTEVTATISGLAHDQGYTPANDPAEKISRSIDGAAVLNAGNAAAVNQAQGAVVANQLRMSQINGAATASARGAPAGVTGLNQHIGNDGLAVNNAEASLQATTVSAGSSAEQTGDMGFSHGFDALDIAFVVSSAHPLTHPFVITVTRFHQKGERAGSARNQVYARQLGPIDSHPTPVRFQEGGFPAGYEVQAFEFHLYDHGVEVATNIAPNYVALTREEAFEYVLIEYLAAHKTDTLPAAVVLSRLPSDFSISRADGTYAKVYYVRVSKEGLAGEAFSDPGCTQRLSDPYLEAIVRTVRFKPALDRGKPVDSVAPLHLGQLARQD